MYMYIIIQVCVQHTHTHTVSFMYTFIFSTFFLSPSKYLAPSGGPGRSTLPMLGSSASWKASLWTRLESLANSIQKAYNQVREWWGGGPSLVCACVYMYVQACMLACVHACVLLMRTHMCVLEKLAY